MQQFVKRGTLKQVWKDNRFLNTSGERLSGGGCCAVLRQDSGVAVLERDPGSYGQRGCLPGSRAVGKAVLLPLPLCET